MPSPPDTFSITQEEKSISKSLYSESDWTWTLLTLSLATTVDNTIKMADTVQKHGCQWCIRFILVLLTCGHMLDNFFLKSLMFYIFFGCCRCDGAMSSHKTLVKTFAFGPKHCMMTGGNQPTMAWTVTSMGRIAELLCYTIPYRSMNSVISSTEVENSFFIIIIFFFFFFFFLFSIPKQQKLSSWCEKSVNLLGRRAKLKRTWIRKKRREVLIEAGRLVTRVFSTGKTPIDVCLSRRIGFFQRTKLTKERHRWKKLNTIEPSASFLPRNRPSEVPSAAPRALRSVYFAVETWPRTLLY